MIYLTQTATEPMSPIVVILIIGILVLCTLASINDRKADKKLLAGIKEQYQGKTITEFQLSKEYSAILTEEELVLITGHEYFVYKLQDIHRIFSGRDMTAKSWCINLWDENGKAVKAEYHKNAKSTNVKMKARLHFIPQKSAEELCAAIINQAPHIQKKNTHR